MQRLMDVILKPVISEKSTALSEVANRFVFEVNPLANKYEIRAAIEKLFEVQVKQVRTTITHGKFKRMRNGIFKKPNKKKAIITLAAGQTIDLFQTQTAAAGAASEKKSEKKAEKTEKKTEKKAKAKAKG